MTTTTREHSLTEGNIGSKLFLFFLPILAGSLFQQLYTTVDAIIVGQFAGKEALAAIDAIYSLIRLPVNFFVGLSTGATILISQSFGAKHQRELSDSVHTAVAFAFAGGLVLSALGVILAPHCLRLLEVPEDIFPYALSYARIYFGGMAFLMTYNIGAGILRAVGDSRTPFYCLLAANALNVLLDLLFIGVWRWHTAGAALSTILAQLLSAALVMRVLLRTSLSCRVTPSKIRFHRPTLTSTIKLGLPVGVQSSLYPIANMFIQSNINRFGTNSIAAWAVCGKLDFMVWLVVDSFGAAIATFVAQNYGARYYDRARKGVRVCMSFSLALVLAISAGLFVWCAPLSRLFVSDSDVITLSTQLMRFLAPMYFLYVGGEIFSGAIRGSGETFKPMLLTLTGTCACRILWILLALPFHDTLVMVLWSYPVSWLVTSLMFVAFYRAHTGRYTSGNG